MKKNIIKKDVIKKLLIILILFLLSIVGFFLINSYNNDKHNYIESLSSSAELAKIDDTSISKETIDKFYAMVKPVNANNRWYDKDPVISKTVEILRIVPPEAQKICAQNFIRTLKEMGIEYESPNKTDIK